jgi:hypothetical protein
VEYSSSGSGIIGTDAGLALMYGVNINRFKIEIGIQYGLTNIYEVKEDEDAMNLKLTTPFIGVSYIF